MRKIIIIFLFFASCINPYHLNQDDSDSPLVVDGYVSTRAGDSEIKISRSGIFQRTVFDWIADAEVMVLENETVEHNFVYHDNGSYKPAQEDFVAKKESSYRLKIVLEGQEYESDPVNIQSSLDIDSLSFKFVAVNQGGDMLANSGLELQLTSSIDEDASRYYIYSFEETWKAVAGYSLNKTIKPIFIYDDNQIPIDIVFETSFFENITDCWSQHKVDGINTSTTEGLSHNQLIKVPVFRVNLESTRLLYRYSVLVNQYAISREAHHFFNMLKEFSENAGFLYDIQPGWVAGNIHNKSTPEEDVIGIFYAASHTSARIFISHSELPHEAKSIVTSYFPKCDYYEDRIPLVHPDSIPNKLLTEKLLFLRDSVIRGRNLVLRDYWPSESDPWTWVQFTSNHCADCRVYGSNVKPSWWE